MENYSGVDVGSRYVHTTKKNNYVDEVVFCLPEFEEIRRAVGVFPN